MTTDPDALEFAYDSERSRAAVAVACLRWLGHTGPPSDRGTTSEAPPIGQPASSDVSDRPFDPDAWPHPLWDRWIDG